MGRGGLFGDRPFATEAFRGFISPQDEQVIAHGFVEILELDRAELEVASRGDLGDPIGEAFLKSARAAGSAPGWRGRGRSGSNLRRWSRS